MNQIKIVAAILDTRQLTIYKEDGTSIIIPQGDSRIQPILDAVLVQIPTTGFAFIEDPKQQEEKENVYKQFEENSNGVVKFFRMARYKVKEFFGSGPVIHSPVSVGEIPELKSTAEVFKEIMEHAVPATSKDFHERGLDSQQVIADHNGNTPGKHVPEVSEETVVAVVDGKIIPGMEKIRSQFGNAVRTTSPQGMENFLTRIAAVIETRSHSVEDLLKFLERGDLPIADDGSIIIYKVLKRKDDQFVDCHTRSVAQWVGAKVCMNEALVDRDRNNECSNGLHVARRGYLKHFYGDVCVLAKLAPEDVIAVPAYDANKMRVCAYHIVAELDEAQYDALRQNKEMPSSEGGTNLLADGVAGNHPHVTHEVEIQGHLGQNVVVRSVNTVEKPATNPVNELVQVLKDEEKPVPAPVVEPSAIAKIVAKPTHKEVVATLYKTLDTTNADLIMGIKKTSKKSWTVLGLTAAQAEKVMLRASK